MRTNVITAIAVAGLSAVLAAPAAGDWTAPQTLSRPHSYVGLGSVGYTATGTAVASWSWQDGLGNGSATGWSMVSGPASRAAFGAERALPADVVSGPRPYGAGRVVVATQSDRSNRSTLRVRLGDLGGRFGRPRVVARRRPTIQRAQLAVNGRGDGALAWSENRRSSTDRIYVSLRRRGGGFGPAVLLGQGPIRSISAAVGPAGHVLVAWDARGRVRTRFKGRSERVFRPVDQLRSQTTFHAVLQTAIAPSGRAWVAWTSQLLTEGGGSGDAYIQVARRSVRAGRFDRALVLEHAPSWAIPSPVSLAIGPGASAVLAWTVWDGGPARQPAFTTVRAAHVSASGVASINQLAHFGAVEAGEHAVAAYADDGNATAAWTQREGAPASTTRAYASVRPAGGDWSAPQLASAGPHVSGLAATYAPGGGSPTLLVANRLTGATDSTVVQAVTRAAR